MLSYLHIACFIIKPSYMFMIMLSYLGKPGDQVLTVGVFWPEFVFWTSLRPRHVHLRSPLIKKLLYSPSLVTFLVTSIFAFFSWYLRKRLCHINFLLHFSSHFKSWPIFPQTVWKQWYITFIYCVTFTFTEGIFISPSFSLSLNFSLRSILIPQPDTVCRRKPEVIESHLDLLFQTFWNDQACFSLLHLQIEMLVAFVCGFVLISWFIRIRVNIIIKTFLSRSAKGPQP